MASDNSTPTIQSNNFYWDAEKERTVYLITEASTEKGVECWVVCPVGDEKKLVIIPKDKFIAPRFTPTEWNPPALATAVAAPAA